MHVASKVATWTNCGLVNSSQDLTINLTLTLNTTTTEIDIKYLTERHIHLVCKTIRRESMYDTPSHFQ